MCDTAGMTNVVRFKLRSESLRTCAAPGCSNMFTATRSTAQYCSNKCRLRATRQRRSKGYRMWSLPLPDETIEGIADALQHERLAVDGCSDEDIIAGIVRHLMWWAEHWRELRRR